MDNAAMRALAELPDDVAGVLAVVVAVAGSAYRRVGAARLVAAGRPPAGVVSGGCVEADLDLRAAACSERGVLVRYDLRGGPDDLWGVASGCNGLLDIWLQPIPAGGPSPYRRAARWLAEGRAVVVATDLDSGEQRAAAEGEPGFAVAGRGGGRLFVDRRRPAPSFLVYGRGPDAEPMAETAARAGFRVRRAASGEDLAAALAAGRPDAAVVMSHNFPGDQRATAALVAAGAPYIGVLGPRERTLRLLPEPWPPSLHAPLGLDIGADSPEEIALAAVAEAVAALRDRPGGALRDRPGPIHPQGAGEPR